MKYSAFASLLLFAACDSAPPDQPTPPAATSVALACGAQSVTFTLPCQVGLPLMGTVSAVECSAEAGSKRGVVTLLVDLGVAPREKFDLPGVVTPVFGDIGGFQVLKGSVVFSQVDAGKRTFVGRLQDVTFQFESFGACTLKDGPFAGVPGNFL